MFEIIIADDTNYFIKQLDKKLRIKTYSLMELLKERGNNLREPHSKALGNGLFELRVKGEDNLVRLFYAFEIGKKIYILHGFIKKTQKTPKKELEIAYERLKEIKNEMG